MPAMWGLRLSKATGIPLSPHRALSRRESGGGDGDGTRLRADRRALSHGLKRFFCRRKMFSLMTELIITSTRNEWRIQYGLYDYIHPEEDGRDSAWDRSQGWFIFRSKKDSPLPAPRQPWIGCSRIQQSDDLALSAGPDPREESLLP